MSLHTENYMRDWKLANGIPVDARISPVRPSLEIKRWRSPQVENVGVARHTKSEAIAWFKDYLGVKKLPDGFVIEAY